jgi:hypothetical protein
MVVVLVQLRLAQSKAWRAGLQPESTVLLREHRRVAALPQAGSFLLRLILAYRRQPSVSVMGENDMNKNILIGLVLIAAAAGGYYQFSVKPAQEAAAAAEAAAAEAAAALDPAAFDAAKINAMIAASTLDDATKATLKAGVDAAATNPALVQGAVDAVKAAMGM